VTALACGRLHPLKLQIIIADLEYRVYLKVSKMQIVGVFR